MQMNNPIGKTPLDDQPNGIVGKPLDRVDGRLKVTGGAVYAYEVEQGPRTAYGYVVQASIGKGRIRSIDSRVAEHMPGVVLVLTHLNAPAQGTGNHHEAHPVLVGPDVSYYGEPVAFVVAETFEQARAAAYAVRVSYETAQGTYALRDGLSRAHVPENAGGAPPDSAVGNFEPAFTAAPVQLDVTYTTPLQSHAMMEPHATLAIWDGDKLTLHTSNQMLNQGGGGRGADPENAAGKRASDQPLHRRWVRLEALGECRCHPGRHRRAAAPAAGEDGADQAADLPGDDASVRYDPAHPDRHGPERTHPGDWPRRVFRQFADRTGI